MEGGRVEVVQKVTQGGRLAGQGSPANQNSESRRDFTSLKMAAEKLGPSWSWQR